MIRRRKWSFLLILIPIAVAGAFLVLAVHYLIDPQLYRNVLQKSLSTQLGKEVTIGNARLTLWGGVGVSLEELRVKDRSQAWDLLQCKRLILKARIIPLLRREVQWSQIILDRPRVRLMRDREGRFIGFDTGLLSFQDNGPRRLTTLLSTLFGGSVAIRDGEILFSDETVADPPWTTRIRSLDLEVTNISYRKRVPFRVAGKWGLPKEGSFSVSGFLQDIPEDLDLSKVSLTSDVKMEGAEISHVWPQLRRFLPVNELSASIHLRAHFEGSLSRGFKTSVTVTLEDLVYDHPRVFASVLRPKKLHLAAEAEYDLKDLSFSRCSVELPDMKIQLKGKIYAIGTSEMGMHAEAETGPFDLAAAKKYIPYRIITPPVSESLYRSEGSGQVRIASVKLSGRMDEIDHCDRLPNAHVVSVEVRTDKVTLKLPWNLPVLANVKSSLSFRGGDLWFKGVDAQFLHSGIQGGEGKFSTLLIAPHLQITGKGKLDLADLPVLAKTAEAGELFSAISALTGRAEYQISATGGLQGAFRFQHRGLYLLSGVHFIHSRLPFPAAIHEAKVELSQEGVEWSGAKVAFGHTSLVSNGSWKYADKGGSFEISGKGKLDLGNLYALSQSAIVPEGVRLKAKGIEGASGTGEISVRIKADGGSPPAFQGEFMVRDARLLARGAPSPIHFRDGSLSFSNTGISFSRIKNAIAEFFPPPRWKPQTGRSESFFKRNGRSEAGARLSPISLIPGGDSNRGLQDTERGRRGGRPDHLRRRI